MADKWLLWFISIDCKIYVVIVVRFYVIFIIFLWFIIVILGFDLSDFFFGVLVWFMRENFVMVEEKVLCRDEREKMGGKEVV